MMAQPNFDDGIYALSDLDGRIVLAQDAYRTADANRGYAGANHYGQIGTQFCGLLAEFIGEMSNTGYDEDMRISFSEDLYRTAWEYYPDYAVLLDGGKLGD